MKKFFAKGGVVFERIPGQRIPLVVAGIALMVLPAISYARGPIVSAAVDWLTIAKTVVAAMF